MKIALVHDALINKGGAEWVFQNFVEMFPSAPIYTTVYLKDKTYPFFLGKNIKTTPLQKIIKNENQFKSLFPLANYYMQKTEVDDADVILSSSTFSGKYISKNKAKHLCYCYTPFRLLWYPNSYKNNKSLDIKLNIIKPFLPLFRKWDYNVVQKIDKFIAMTTETQKRIWNVYKKDSTIIHPPIDFSKYGKGKGTGNYFLVVSRLEPYKRVDLVIESFNEIGLPLKIVGKGTLEGKLKITANKNIEFLGSVSDEELIKLYQNCITVILPQKEDYGLVPIESNACGKPVICYGFGGVETTMVPFNNDSSNATAVFFYEQSKKSLINAINQFEKINFNSVNLLDNAKRFDKPIFKEKIMNLISSVL